MADFDPACDLVLKHEGGYVCNPADPGGATKFGISQRAYPELAIADLSAEQARGIYKRDWWDKHPFAQLVDQGVANKVFDLAVNMGAEHAVKVLQAAIFSCGMQIVQDGVLGPGTVRSANAIWPDDLLPKIRDEAVKHYQRIVVARPAEMKFLKGWLARANA